MTGSQQNFERGDTAPLNAIRDGGGTPPDRMRQGWGSGARSEGAAGERTRPAFPLSNQVSPHAASSPAAGSGPVPAPGPGPAASGAGLVSPKAGTGTGGEGVPAGPDGGGSPEPGGVGPTGWLLRALVLCAVSVVSGLLWLAVKPSPPSPPSPAAESSGTDEPDTEYEFDRYMLDEPSSCAKHSTMKVAEFFASNPCSHATRALYTTRLPNGERVLTSVVTVLMPDQSSATELEELVTRNNTGNIRDLVSAGHEVPEDYPDLTHDYGYASEQRDRLVVIGESSYFHRSDRDDGRLKHVTTEALLLGPDQDRDPG